MKRVAFIFIVILTFAAFAFQDSKIDYKKQIQDFTQQISKDPQNLALYYSRARAYDALNDFAGANKDYGKVIELYYNNPKKEYADQFSKAYYLLADDYYYRKGDKEKALKCVQEGLRVTPDFKDLQIFEAVILGSDPNQKELAGAKFIAAIDKYPNDDKLNYHYAKFLEKLDPSEAIPYYEKVAELDPSNYDVLFTLATHYTNEAGRIYKESGDISKATEYTKKGVAYFEKVFELNPKDKEVFNILLQLYQTLDREEDIKKLQELAQ